MVYHIIYGIPYIIWYSQVLSKLILFECLVSGSSHIDVQCSWQIRSVKNSMIVIS